MTSIPPNGGYGWVCTLGVFLINAHTWGLNNSWGVFLAYFSSHQTYQGATQIQYALIGGLSTSQALITAPLVTKLCKHVGMRASLFIGAALLFLSLFTSSYATKIWHLFLSQGLCFGWGMGLLYVPASAALPAWFTTRRSLAVGLATSGAGFGGLAYSFVANWAIETLGVPWTYRILAFCALVANLLAILLLKEFQLQRPTSSSNQSRQDVGTSRLQDLGRIEVLLVVAWGLTTDFGFATLMYCLPTYASSIGLTVTQGTIANALFNLGQGLSRPAVGYLSDQFGRINTAMLMTALSGIFCFGLWIPASDFPLLAVFAFLAGCISGTFWVSVTPIIVELVGLRKFTRIFGIICMFVAIPETFGEPVAMQLVDSHSGFLMAQVFVGCMFMAGALSLWFLRAWKIDDLEMVKSEGLELGSDPQDVLSISANARGRRSPWFVPRTLFKLKRV